MKFFIISLENALFFYICPLFSYQRKEKGTESQKRMQWLLYLKKMISFMRFMCEKNIFPPNTFPI